jgi:phage-related holin
MKLLTILLLFSISLDPVFSIFEIYVFNDWNFVGFMMVLLILDTITGILAAWKQRRIHSFKMRMIWEKIGYYALALIVIHIMSSYQVDGKHNQVFEMIVPYFKAVMYLILIGTEALSIDENAKKIWGKGFFPKWITSRMLEYNETGKLPEQP